MKKLILLILLIPLIISAQSDMGGNSFGTRNSLWYFVPSGNLLKPQQSTWSLSGITNITYTGQILAPDGTNSSPSYALSTETNTGFYKYASGQIAFSSAGTARILFTSSAVQIFNDAGGLFLGTSSDVALRREAADVLALRRSTNHQSFRIYDEDGTTSDRYTRNAWTTDSLYVIQQVISGSKTSRGMLFDDFASYTFDNTLLPATTNAVSLGSTDFIWSTGVSGTWTLGDDSDNVSGQLNFIASDGDAGNIAINTDDRLVITDFATVLSSVPFLLKELTLGYNGNALISTNDTNENLAINPNGSGATLLYESAAFYVGAGSSLTDSSIVFNSSSGSPVLNWYGTDGDTWNIGINTSDQATFNGAGGGYKFDAGSLILSGNISANAWTTNGIGLVRQAGTFTDLTSSGTVANAYTNVLGGNTIAATNSTTFTNYYTTYINAPVAGSNVTITNPYALGVGGNTLQTGNLSVQSSLITDERVVTLADSASISIATGVAGFGRVMIGDNQEEAEIKWKADGTVTLIRNSTNVASDGTTDSTLNIYDGGDGIVIKNLLGSQLKLAISLKYYTP